MQNDGNEGDHEPGTQIVSCQLRRSTLFTVLLLETGQEARCKADRNEGAMTPTGLFETEPARTAARIKKRRFCVSHFGLMKTAALRLTWHHGGRSQLTTALHDAHAARGTGRVSPTHGSWSWLEKGLRMCAGGDLPVKCADDEARPM